MVYVAKLLGASAVLLICALLSTGELRDYLALCDHRGLSARVEVHGTEIESALQAGARIVGVNHRNLRDFSVDTGHSARLRALVPPGVLYVAESGIRTPAEVDALRHLPVDAVLVGETLMRAPDKKAALETLRGDRQ
jgi:indole-3-glycerol phosphate synthase